METINRVSSTTESPIALQTMDGGAEKRLQEQHRPKLPGLASLERSWTLNHAQSAFELTRLLREHIWLPTTAFWVLGHPDYLFLNEAQSCEDFQDYAVVKVAELPGHYMKIDGFAVDGWTFDELIWVIDRVLAGKRDHPEFPMSNETFPLDFQVF